MMRPHLPHLCRAAIPGPFGPAVVWACYVPVFGDESGLWRVVGVGISMPDAFETGKQQAMRTEAEFELVDGQVRPRRPVPGWRDDLIVRH